NRFRGRGGVRPGLNPCEAVGGLVKLELTPDNRVGARRVKGTERRTAKGLAEALRGLGEDRRGCAVGEHPQVGGAAPYSDREMADSPVRTESGHHGRDVGCGGKRPAEGQTGTAGGCDDAVAGGEWVSFVSGRRSF